MKVIMQKTVDRLGDPGDVAEVADGYARNYLIPRGLAVKAEKGTVLQQSPNAGQTLDKGSTVTIVVSTYEEPEPPPSPSPSPSPSVAPTP